MKIFGMELMRLVGIILTLIALISIGYSLHPSCDQSLQFLTKEQVNVSYIGNDTVITIKNKHISVITEPPGNS